jgi:hypothetical protein
MCMNRRHLLPIGSALAAAGIIVTACSSGAASPAVSLPPLGSLTVPSIAIPSIAIPSVALPSNLPSIAIPSVALPSNLPSIAIPSIALPSGSFDIPSFDIPSFSFPSEDKDLEARLPNEINGVTLVKYSFKGATFLESGADNQQDLVDFLSALGKSPNDLSVAFAGDANGDLDLQLGAFRVAGADSNALLSAFVAATQKESPQDTVTQGNVGGKNVTQIVDPDDTESGTIYIYANGDTLFYVSSPDASLAAAGLTALP